MQKATTIHFNAFLSMLAASLPLVCLSW